MLGDVVHDAEAPIVITGAIRPASAPGADGPANLSDAVSVAASEAAAGMGVLVVFGGEIHHARCVRKTDTTSLVAFSSPQTGPLGRVTESHPIIWSKIPRNPPMDPKNLDKRVLVVPTMAGDDGSLAHAALATDPDGVIIGTLGAGHLGPPLLDVWAEAAERFPVVAYCRPERGVVLNSTYGYPGPSATCATRGSSPPASCRPQAARMKLWPAWPATSRPRRSAGPSGRTTAEPGNVSCRRSGADRTMDAHVHRSAQLLRRRL